MNDDLLRKIKLKRIRIVAILAVIALFAGSTIFAISMRQAKEDKQATTEPAAQEEVQEQAPDQSQTVDKEKEEQEKKEKKAKEEAAEVDELIESIGEVTLAKDDLVTEARAAYDKLSEDARKEVTRLETLEEAEESLKKLQEEDKQKQEEQKKEEERKKEEEKKEEAARQEEENAQEQAAAGKTVTIEINCSELSNNMDRLTDDGLAKYVPSSGVILGKTNYAFTDSATVYDALKKVCRDNGIHYIQETGSGYSGVYISSINHLAEFDGGKNSGWMYKVNGSTPNVSCSEYELSDGDTIYWFYTINYTEE